MDTEYREYSFGIGGDLREQVTVETSVNTAERGGISEVLSLEAEAKLLGVEMMQGEALLSGKVNYRLLYTDGAGKLCGLDYFKDFETRLVSEDVTADGKWDATLAVIDCGYDVQGDAVTVSAVVDVSLRAYRECKMRGVAAIPDAELLTGRMETERFIGKREFLLDLDKEENVGCLVKKVLLFDTQAVVLSVEEKEDALTVSGEARAVVLYLTEEDIVGEKSFVIPFSQEMEARGKSLVSAAMKNARVVISGDESVSAVEAEMTVSVTVSDLERESVETVKDVFLPAAEAVLVKKTMPAEIFLGETRKRESIAASIALDGADEILIVRPVGLAVAGSEVKEGAIRVEGVASFDVVYKKEESCFSRQGELPFVSEIPFSGAEAGDKAKVRADVIGARGSLTASGADIAAELVLAADLSRLSESALLTDVAEGEARADDGAGISVYFAEAGEDLWGIAKNMGVMPSALLRANPFLAEPLSEAKKVLVFKAK